MSSSSTSSPTRHRPPTRHLSPAAPSPAPTSGCVAAVVSTAGSLLLVSLSAGAGVTCFLQPLRRHRGLRGIRTRLLVLDRSGGLLAVSLLPASSVSSASVALSPLASDTASSADDPEVWDDSAVLDDEDVSVDESEDDFEDDFDEDDESDDERSNRNPTAQPTQPLAWSPRQRRPPTQLPDHQHGRRTWRNPSGPPPSPDAEQQLLEPQEHRQPHICGGIR